MRLAAIPRVIALWPRIRQFYTTREAVRWYRSPQPPLEMRRPLDMLATEAGLARLERSLAQLEDGAYV